MPRRVLNPTPLRAMGNPRRAPFGETAPAVKNDFVGDEVDFVLGAGDAHGLSGGEVDLVFVGFDLHAVIACDELHAAFEGKKAQALFGADQQAFGGAEAAVAFAGDGDVLAGLQVQAACCGGSYTGLAGEHEVCLAEFRGAVAALARRSSDCS